MIAAPCLEVFKARLDGAVRNVVEWKLSLPMAVGFEQDDLQGPFQPKPFGDSMSQLLAGVSAAQLPYNMQLLDCGRDPAIGIILCGSQENDKAEKDSSTSLQISANWDNLGFDLYLMNMP
ncbi:hypothetical protein BTVI_68824 [Pitangus sulphuratus]|nr:hypothetical protein BTVI_68824 [Pitangus sulphuratus]